MFTAILIALAIAAAISLYIAKNVEFEKAPAPTPFVVLTGKEDGNDAHELHLNGTLRSIWDGCGILDKDVTMLGLIDLLMEKYILRLSWDKEQHMLHAHAIGMDGLTTTKIDGWTIKNMQGQKMVLRDGKASMPFSRWDNGEFYVRENIDARVCVNWTRSIDILVPNAPCILHMS